MPACASPACQVPDLEDAQIRLGFVIHLKILKVAWLSW